MTEEMETLRFELGSEKASLAPLVASIKKLRLTQRLGSLSQFLPEGEPEEVWTVPSSEVIRSSLKGERAPKSVLGFLSQFFLPVTPEDRQIMPSELWIGADALPATFHIQGIFAGARVEGADRDGVEMSVLGCVMIPYSNPLPIRLTDRDSGRESIVFLGPRGALALVFDPHSLLVNLAKFREMTGQISQESSA